MKRYEVEFSDRAIEDREASFEWGCENWGASQAAKWYFEMRDKIDGQLSNSPLGYPLTPQTERFKAEARVLTIDRYNVVFHVKGRLVTILHIRGPFTKR